MFILNAIIKKQSENFFNIDTIILTNNPNYVTYRKCYIYHVMKDQKGEKRGPLVTDIWSNPSLDSALTGFLFVCFLRCN